MDGEKKERPQNKNLKPLGSGNLTPEEELAIRRKGKIAADKARKRNADIRKAVQAYANLRSKGKGKSLDAEHMKTIDEVLSEDAPQIMLLIHTQWLKALNGDNEARDWICKMLGIEDALKDVVQGLTVTADQDALEQPGGVRIHIIRGEKPREDESEEDAATRAANRLAVVEAMKAIGESADQIGQAVADKLNEATEDVSPDE